MLVVDKFQEIMSNDQSPLCLFPTRQMCQDFNFDMLVELHSKVKEIPCIDEVNETKGTFKWTKKAIQAKEKLKTDCNLMGRLRAVLKVEVSASCHAP